MDDFPAIEKPKAADLKEVSTPGTVVPKVPGVRGVPLVLPTDSGKRKIKKRHPFDIYEDQIEELKKLSLEDRMQGGFGSQSAMVREALRRSQVVLTSGGLGPTFDDLTRESVAAVLGEPLRFSRPLMRHIRGRF